MTRSNQHQVWLLIALGIVVATHITTAHSKTPTRIDWSYPAMAERCLLQEQAAVDGVTAMNI
jgi:hypothetical protein